MIVSQINPPNTIRVASYTTCASPSFNSTKPISKRVPEIISMKLLPDTRDIVLVTRTGDIATLPMEEEEAQVWVFFRLVSWASYRVLCFLA